MRNFAWRSGRADVEMRVDLKTAGDSFPGTLKSIGVGGLFVATDGSFHVGERLAVRFTLSELDHSISVSAEVRWIREGQGRASGMGLRFVRLPLVSAVAIQEFLRKLDEDLTPSWPST